MLLLQYMLSAPFPPNRLLPFILLPPLTKEMKAMNDKITRITVRQMIAL